MSLNFVFLEQLVKKRVLKGPGYMKTGMQGKFRHCALNFVTRDRPYFFPVKCEMTHFFLVNRDFPSSREA